MSPGGIPETLWGRPRRLITVTTPLPRTPTTDPLKTDSDGVLTLYMDSGLLTRRRRILISARSAVLAAEQQKFKN